MLSAFILRSCIILADLAGSFDAEFEKKPEK
jgi:hypothetical protein